MNSFLNAVARGYAGRYKDLSALTFVMPNKRSGSFLIKAFADIHSVPVIAPRVLPVVDFISSVADNIPDSRIDLLFRLYDSYRSLPGADASLSFDKFCSWGDIILSDFIEIDMQSVDAGEIFKNVYDLNAIKSNFLSRSQRKVMADYFGYSADMLDADLSSLWQNFSKEGDKRGSRKFFALWQLLYPLYEMFKARLNEAGLTTSGGVYREAADKIEAGFQPFEGDKIIFVGFNALSGSELRIFSALKSMKLSSGESKADFIWDLAPAVFMAEDSPALKYVTINSNKDNFPPPDWILPLLRSSFPTSRPSIKVISVPSNVMQAKVAGLELRDMLHYQTVEGEEDSRQKSFAAALKNARIAIVLPDENLLLPLLHSLPDSIRNPNLTMGFPLKHTPVIGFASLLRRLHRGAFTEDNMETLYHFEDVKDFLAHPYTRLLFPRKAVEEFVSRYEARRRVVVPQSVLSELGPEAAMVFRNFSDNTDPLVVLDYILEILASVRNALESPAPGSYLRSFVEKNYIGTYTDSLIKLRHCIEEFPIVLSPADVFSLSDRMISGESVVFDGKPLEGLQVMGVLETRCLDFDKIIMLSVNEKVMPRVGRNSTFIPNIIRLAFGMPPANYQEELFAYYFFRVLGRCSSSVLTYDSRSSENRTPGPSRYLLQMKYLVEGLSLQEVEARFELPRGLEGDIVVEKNDDIAPYLDRYLESGDKRISASALSHYFNCPVQFLYGDVLGLGENREKMETIDAVDFGKIVHKVMERLYFPAHMREKILKHPILIDSSFLDSLLSEVSVSGQETRVEREARKAILEIHFGVTDERKKLHGSASIIFDYIVKYIKNILNADRLLTPFRLWGSEISITLPYELTSKADGDSARPRTVNLKMVIDRLDQEGAEGVDSPFRIVDYKTGNVHLEADGLDQIFDGTYKSKNIFQLLFYAELLLMEVKKGNVKLGITSVENFEQNLKTVIYCIPSLPDPDGFVVPAIGKIPGKKEGVLKPREIATIGELRQLEAGEGRRIMEYVEGIIDEIFDKNVPFKSVPTEERCAYCDFRLRCESKRASQKE